MKVLDCDIVGNTSIRGNGGGLYGTLGTISNCTFASNLVFTNTAQSEYGGAGLVVGPGQLLLDSRVYNNTIIYGNGGGVTISGGTIDRCVITNNSALGGIAGGIFHSSNTLGTNLNCLVAYNRANRGGGVACSGYGNCFSSTIVSNTALTSGGGYYKYAGNSAKLSQMENCIFYFNEGPDLTYNYHNYGTPSTRAQ